MMANNNINNASTTSQHISSSNPGLSQSPLMTQRMDTTTSEEKRKPIRFDNVASTKYTIQKSRYQTKASTKDTLSK